MPLPSKLREELNQRHSGEHGAAERDQRRDWIRTGLICWGWALFGLALIGLGLHTTDSVLGTVAFYGGIGAGNAGIIFTILAAYRRGEARGDW